MAEPTPQEQAAALVPPAPPARKMTEILMRKGSGMFIDPKSGALVAIRESGINNALLSGLQPATEQDIIADREKDFYDAPVKAAVIAAARGGTFGLSDTLLPEGAAQKFREASPITNAIFEAGGAIASSAVGPLGLATKALRATVPGVAGRSLAHVAEGMAVDLGGEISDAATGENAHTAGIGTATAGVIGALGLASAGLGKLLGNKISTRAVVRSEKLIEAEQEVAKAAKLDNAGKAWGTSGAAENAIPLSEDVAKIAEQKGNWLRDVAFGESSGSKFARDRVKEAVASGAGKAVQMVAEAPIRRLLTGFVPEALVEKVATGVGKAAVRGTTYAAAGINKALRVTGAKTAKSLSSQAFAQIRDDLDNSDPDALPTVAAASGIKVDEESARAAANAQAFLKTKTSLLAGRNITTENRAKFTDYVNHVADPTLLYSQLIRNEPISERAIETHQAVYPDMLNAVRMAAYKELLQTPQNAFASLPLTPKRNLRLLLGPKVISDYQRQADGARIQALYAPAQQSSGLRAPRPSASQSSQPLTLSQAIQVQQRER